MDIRQLKYFLTIAQEGQITSAAKKLHMSQPPLSQQLKLFEDELGIKLFERGSRNVKLTSAGKLLKVKAQQILELTDVTIKEVQDFKSGLIGTLSIGTVSSSGCALLPEKIQNFHNIYPDIKFNIKEGNTFKILELLDSGLIEIGIVRTPFKTENYNFIKLLNDEMIAVYRKNSFEFSKDNIKLQDLNNKPIIIYSRFEGLIFNCFENIGITPLISCKTEDARTALQWSNFGIGIAIVLKSAFNLVNNHNLSYSTITCDKLTTNVAAIYLKNKYLSSLAKHFLEIFSDNSK
ncbi:MAG: LysR family transcriptional regulator [Clostridium sp.]|nr:LysR family transcriptional regulator [Clostridium sp.]